MPPQPPGGQTDVPSHLDAPSRAARIAVVNDYELVVRGLAGMLAPYSDRVEVVEAIVADEPVHDGPVDVALFDTFGQPSVPRAHIDRLVRDPQIGRVAIYSFDHDPDDLLDAGAVAYLSKATPAGQLVEQLERIAAGEQVRSRPRQVMSGTTRSGREWPGRELGLSEREAEVAVLAALGHRNADIGVSLCIGVDTVKTHLSRAFRKVGVHNRTELSVLLHGHLTFRRLTDHPPPRSSIDDGLRWVPAGERA